MSAGTELAVDIVIDNHDLAEFVGLAVASALAQEHPRVHVVVVDDGSTDGSREVLAGFADEVDLVLKENGGQASAVNAGLERCRGDVVMVLDADDVLHPHAAARVADAFAAAPGAARVQFRMDVVDADGVATGAHRPPAHLRMPSGDLAPAELAHPFDLVCLPTSGNAFRRDRLQRILPIPVHDFPRAGADWYLVHLSSLLGTVVAVDEVCASYRVHGRNLYESGPGRLDLGQVRQSIAYGEVTARALAQLADELGHPRPRRILSVADLANRLVSLRLEPRRHPVAGDRPAGLVRDAVRAARRRRDVAAPMRLLFVAWFAVTAAAPRPLARLLAALFLLPERRAGLNRLLARLHRPGALGGGA